MICTWNEVYDTLYTTNESFVNCNIKSFTRKVQIMQPGCITLLVAVTGIQVGLSTTWQCHTVCYLTGALCF
jgi:hypothetical protein